MIFCLPSGWPAETMMSPLLCLSPGGGGEELWISPTSRTQEKEILRLRMQVGSRGWVSFLCLLFSWVSWCHCSSHLEKQTGRLFNRGCGHTVPGQPDAINSSTHPPFPKHTPWTAVTHVNHFSLPDWSVLLLCPENFNSSSRLRTSSKKHMLTSSGSNRCIFMWW